MAELNKDINYDYFQGVDSWLTNTRKQAAFWEVCNDRKVLRMVGFCICIYSFVNINR